MARVKYKMEGFKELNKALNGLTEPKFRQQALRTAGRKSTDQLLSALKSAAPVIKNADTLPEGSYAGELRDSIRRTVSTPKQPKLTRSGKKITKASRHELRVIITVGNSKVDYAPISEYGREETPIMRYSIFGRPVLGFETKLPALPAKPWIRPTFDASKGKVIDSFQKELTDSIKKKAKQQARIHNKR